MAFLDAEHKKCDECGKEVETDLAYSMYRRQPNGRMKTVDLCQECLDGVIIDFRDAERKAE